MLTHSIFVMFIGGQPVMTEQKASEVECNRKLVRIVTLKRTQGNYSIGARYFPAISDNLAVWPE